MTTGDAANAKWFSNKTWAIIIVFIGTILFHLGGELSGKPDISKFEKRMDKVEKVIIKLEVINGNVATTLKRLEKDIEGLETDIKEGFKELKTDMIRVNG